MVSRLGDLTLCILKMQKFFYNLKIVQMKGLPLTAVVSNVVPISLICDALLNTCNTSIGNVWLYSQQLSTIALSECILEHCLSRTHPIVMAKLEVVAMVIYACSYPNKF